MVRYSTIVPHQKRMRHDETPKPKKSEIARLRIQNRVPAYVPNHFVIPKSRFPFLILKFLRNLPVWVLQMLEPQKKNTMRPPVQVERTFFSRCPRIGRCKLWLRRWVLAPMFGAKDHGFDIFWVVVSNIFYFHPYLGKIPSLTNIFQMG